MVSIKEIKKLTYKKHNAFTATYIKRPLSYIIIKLLIPFKISGNQVSLFNILFFMVPLILISVGKKNLAIVGASLLFFSSLLDFVDGGLARYYQNKTLMGKYLESLFHEVCIPLLFFALSIHSFRYFNNPYMLILGTITVFSIFLINITMLNKGRIVLGYSLKKNISIKKVQQHLLVSNKSKNPIKRMVFYIIFIFNSVTHLFNILLLLAIFGLLQYAIIFYSLFYFLIAIAKFSIELKKGFKEYEFE